MTPDETKPRPKSFPVCTRCEHYFVTWDEARPHGCRAFGFKSKKRPSVEVYENSGIQCTMFQAKTGPEH